MAKYYGAVGFYHTYEDPNSPGDWISGIVEKNYYGDVIRNKRSYEATSHLNDSIVIKNEISILANDYAYRNLHEIRYVTWLGTKWKVIEMDIQYPRIILSIGGVYNDTEGPQAGTSQQAP